jgi:hypothetical protein
MEDRSFVINLWEVISCSNGRENHSFYKTVLLNSKSIAMPINKDEYQQLNERLRGVPALEEIGMDYPEYSHSFE